ncbi:MAG TPA: EF-hand domain-containing protein [Planctomycetaceae bacterium]|nr:EF-hand domain-containing protein [Planctomycetaceae bacterium]
MRHALFAVVGLAALFASLTTLAQPPARGGGGGRDEGPPPPPPNPVVEALDKNGDGVISADELQAATESLKKLDKNGDGKLTDDETRPTPPPGGREGGDRGRGGPGDRGAGGPPPGRGAAGRGPREGDARGGGARNAADRGRGQRDGGPGRGPQERAGGRPMPHMPPSILPPPVRESLNLTADQQQQVEKLDQDCKAGLDKILTTEQKQQLDQMRKNPPPFGRGDGPPPGQGPPGRGNGGPPGGGRGPRPDSPRDNPSF